MAADLGLGPWTWLLLTLLLNVSIYLKFNRIWSLRNLDVLLLFVLAPGMMALVGKRGDQSWVPYAWLLTGSAFWLARCLVDLGLSRRPLLEPNLNAAGLTSLSAGVMALLVVETILLPLDTGAARNPADTASPGSTDVESHSAVSQVDGALLHPALPVASEPGVVRWRSTQIILSRILAGLGQIGLVAALLLVGWRHFGRPIMGLSAASCYLLMPYTRIEVVDSGQVVPAALVVAALASFQSPLAAGLMLGLAGGVMPPCLGLIPLWTGFYWKRGATSFVMAAVGVAATCAIIGITVPGLDTWARALGARSLAEAGLIPGVEAPTGGSMWSGLDPVYRLPVLILYGAMMIVTALWPGEKTLGEVIALSAAILIGSQFWYLERGGTLVLLYLPLILLMVFRPNLSHKRPKERPPRRKPAQEPATAPP
jgi:hypothetical protein